MGKKKAPYGPWGEWKYNTEEGLYIRSRINRYGDKQRQKIKPDATPQDGDPQPVSQQQDDVTESMSEMRLSTDDPEPDGGVVSPQGGHMLPLSSPDETSSLQSSTSPIATSVAPLPYSQGQGYYYSGQGMGQYNSTALNVSLSDGYDSRYRMVQSPTDTRYTAKETDNMSANIMPQFNGNNSYYGNGQNPAYMGNSSTNYGASDIPGNSQNPAYMGNSSTNYGANNMPGNTVPLPYSSTVLPTKSSSGGQSSMAPSNNSYNNQRAGRKGPNPLSKDFKKCNSRDFKLGYVFKILWSEPMGSRNGHDVEGDSDWSWFSKTQYDGEESYSSIRRFVICRTYYGHSTCLPIHTYSRRGSNKPGIKPEHHAVIYMGTPQDLPQSSRNQRRLTNKPICIEPMDPEETLAPESRINYAKPHAVEHNLKVSFIGKVHQDSIDEFNATYNRIHNGTTFQPRPIVGTTINEDNEGAQEGRGYVHPENEKFGY